MPGLGAVLDTHVLLSGIAYPGSIAGKLLAAWRYGALEVVLSGTILDERRRVLPRLAHRLGLSAQEIDDLINALAIQAEVVEPEIVLDPELTDEYVQPVLGTLISGDKALLALRDRCPIRTPAVFWTAHGSV